MKRKLIQLSPSTSVISLPRKWVRENNLKKGTELDVSIQENKIIVDTTRKTQESEMKIDISKSNKEMMWMKIDTAYGAGYDMITIQTSGPGQNSYLNKVVRYFPGMMIFDESKNEVQFKTIEKSTQEIESVLSRIFNLITSLIEDSIDSIQEKEYKELSRVKYRDYIINSYISYCLRTLNKWGHPTFSKIGPLHTLIKTLEIFSDKLCIMFEEVAVKRPRKVLQNELVALQEINVMMRTAYNKYSTKRLEQLEEKRASLKGFANGFETHIKELQRIVYAYEELLMQLNS